MSDSLLRIAVPKGKTVFSEGDAGDGAYIIESGRVGVLVARDGAEVQIAERGPGDLFGEMAIIDNRPRSASIVALEDCVLLKLTGSQLAHRVEAADPVIRLVLDVVLARFRETLAQPGTVAAPAPAASSDHRTAALAQMRLEQELEVAIAAGTFELHYQPIVDLSTDETAGFEALIRWRHAERGLVPPGAFIPAAEASGLIVPLSEWCLRRACAGLKTFRQALPPGRGLFVSVNVSGVDLQRPDFFERYKAILDDARTDPAGIKLVVTEGVLMTDPDRVVEDTTIARARVCGSACISMIDSTGPAGNPPSSRSFSQSPVVRRTKMALSASVNAPRFAIRPVFIAKRGSSFNSGTPTICTSRSQLVWFAAPILIHPSAVLNA
jgi:CRP-like cAMP-binding protein